MAKGSIAALCLALLAGSAIASELLGPAAEIRGIRLGERLSNAYKPCPVLPARLGSSSGSVMFMPADRAAEIGPCYSMFDAGAVEQGIKPSVIVNLPLVRGLGTWVSFALVDGTIEEVEMMMESSSYELMLAALSQKFGPVTRHGVERFQNAFGQQTTGRTATWVGSGAVLVLSEHRAGAKDVGYVTLMSNKLLQSVASKKQEQIKATASGL